MTVTKCDRCKREIHTGDPCASINASDKTIKYAVIESSVDLCKDCYHAFIDWICAEDD